MRLKYIYKSNNSDNIVRFGINGLKILKTDFKSSFSILVFIFRFQLLIFNSIVKILMVKQIH